MDAPLRAVSPVWAAVAGSLLLSLVTWLFPAPINNDGVLYLRAASAWLEGGFEAANAVYTWPFYSMAIASVSTLGLTLLQAGQLINALLFAVLSGATVGVVGRLWPDSGRTQWIAAAAILLLPELAELRHEVVRDTGFLTFLIISFGCFIGVVNRGRWQEAAAWLLAVAVATLFRIEAALLGATGALALLLIPQRRAAGGALLLIYAVAGAAAFLLLRRYAPESRVADLVSWWHFFTDEFAASFGAIAARLEEHVLNTYSYQFSRESVVVIVLVILVWTVFKGLTPVHALALWLRRRALGLARPHLIAWWAYAIGVLVPPLLFGLKHLFLTQRYVMGIVLMTLLLATRAWALLAGQGRRVQVALLLVLLLFGAATLRKVVGFDDEGTLAGRWLATQPGSLWANQVRLGFYADPTFKRQVTVDWHPGWEQRLPAAAPHDWLAILVRDEGAAAALAWAETAGYVEVRRFGRGGREVVVLRNAVPARDGRPMTGG